MRLPRVLVIVSALVLALGAIAPDSREQRLWRHRNLGKAFYENPTTKAQAVEEFRQALKMDPSSARDRLNYGLALLRVGKVTEGMAELERVQKQDPRIPQTWFNLGIEYKRQNELQKAIEQFRGMLRLLPAEPKSHYNLGYLYEISGTGDAVHEFETAEQLDPELAAPHFQLFNLYRRAGRQQDADRELKLFNEIKRQQADAVIPEDVEWSPYAEIYDAEPRPWGLRTIPPPPKFEARKVGGVSEVAGAGLAVLDLYGTGSADLLVWFRDGVQIFRNGTTLVAHSGLEGLRNVESIAPGDFNNDGLPDLCVLTAEGASLYVNHNGFFERFPANLPVGHFVKALWLDYDHDYDMDLFLFGEHSVLLRNEGTAGFSDQRARFPFVAGWVLDAVRFELHPDSNERDIVATYADRTAVLYRDKQGGHYEATSLDAIPPETTSLLSFDIDNDGWEDLIGTSAAGISIFANRNGTLHGSLATTGAKGPIAIADYNNRGAADIAAPGVVYRNSGEQFRAQQAQVPAFVSTVAADFDSDGRVDLAGIAADGSVEVLFNRTSGTSHWIRVQLRGVKNVKLAAGAAVELKAADVYEKRIYDGVSLSFGLDGKSEIETVRITWPNGLVQNEIRPPADRTLISEEKPRLSGSCPMIFAWDGHKFAFVSDVLGVAPLGASDGDGHYFPVNHREYVKVPGPLVPDAEHRYELRVTEELHEVSYIDQLELLAVDHPRSAEVLTNDKFKAPPFPEFRWYSIGRKVPPVRATDQQGRDVLRDVVRADGRYVHSFRRDNTGVAEMHYLDLDFGDAAPANHALLVLQGWVDWADGSTFLAAAQERKGGLVFPYLQVKNAAGKWQTVIEDMGMPSGKPRRIVVDLSGKFLSKSRAIRIGTDLCIYWDEIFLAEQQGTGKLRVSSLPAEEANLHFRGFSHPIIKASRMQPEEFIYQQVTPATAWNPIAGLYTRYGDVRALLLQTDDQMVIMGSGDEIALRFNASALPSLPSGWVRDFFLMVDGWAKDGDSNTAFSSSVEPLPFHGMSAYPYPPHEHFPDDDPHRQYVSEYLTRPAAGLLSALAPAAQESRPGKSALEFGDSQ